MLDGIRGDFARPTVHARNLYHVSAAMYDAWAAYDPIADGLFSDEKHTAADVEAARAEAISYAVYRMLQFRFVNSPGALETLQECDDLMDMLGYDKTYAGTIGDDPASFGNRLASEIIAFGMSDGSNELNGFENEVYEPVNEALLPEFPGNPTIVFPNRWQPLALEFFIDQSGNPVPTGYPDFLSPEWGEVVPFSMTEADVVEYERDGSTWKVWHDPGPPPYINGQGDSYYRQGFTMVAVWSSHLDPTTGVVIDASPAGIGNAPLADPGQWWEFYDYFNGGDWGEGWDLNPVTNQPYDPQIVPLGDYGRILAEFWADGPDSETPPGHWFTILNYVSDHPLTEKRFTGVGPIVNDLEWDVKCYLAMGGAMHDVAISAWSVKGYYDYLRPISAIRYMADQGQSTNPAGPSFSRNGIPLHPGYVEVVTEETIMPGERHEHLAGDDNENVGKIAIMAWRGPDYIGDPETTYAGVGWILAENWWPYQRPTFVTPPFAGYVSGHSTYSRAAAIIMEKLTGSAYFPGGMGEFHCPQNEFLVFEDGPSMDVTLQWATYKDASDQCSLSRIWGGIHPGADDLPGRHIGEAIGPEAFDYALAHYLGQAECPGDIDADGMIGFNDLLQVVSQWGPCALCPSDLTLDGSVDFQDLLAVLGAWGPCS